MENIKRLAFKISRDIIDPSFLAPAGENFCPPKINFPFSADNSRPLPYARIYRESGENALRSILLIRLGGLGDLLVAYPSIALIRRVLSSGSGPVLRRSAEKKQAGRGAEESQADQSMKGPQTLHPAGERKREFDEAFLPAALSLACRAEYGVLLKETGVVDDLLDAGSAPVSGLFGGAGVTTAREGRSVPSPASAYDLVAGWMQSETTRADLERFLRTPGGPRVHLMGIRPGSGRLSRFFFDETREFLRREGASSFPSFEECAFLSVPSSWTEEGKKLRPASGAKFGDAKSDDAKSGDAKSAGAKSGGIKSGDAKSIEKFAVVHVGSGSRSKRWPLANFIDVVSRLSAAGVSGTIVSGEAEEDIVPSLRSTALPEGWRWVHQPPLRALAGMIASAGLYLGNDSGVTHLAAACGASGAAVFRREFESLWEPYGNIQIISADDIKNITPAAVWERCCRISAII